MIDNRNNTHTECEMRVSGCGRGFATIGMRVATVRRSRTVGRDDRRLRDGIAAQSRDADCVAVTLLRCAMDRSGGSSRSPAASGRIVGTLLATGGDARRHTAVMNTSSRIQIDREQHRRATVGIPQQKSIHQQQ